MTCAEYLVKHGNLNIGDDSYSILTYFTQEET